MKTFDTIESIITDDVFVTSVAKHLTDLIKVRISRPAVKPGFKYKRDWYDRMSSEYQLNTTFFINNIKSVWLKKSSLSSEIRNIVQFVCYQAYNEMLLHYQKQDETD